MVDANIVISAILFPNYFDDVKASNLKIIRPRKYIEKYMK